MEYLGSLGDDKTVCGGVIRQFQAICAYPHGSWHEEPLVDYLEALCRSRGWTTIRDTYNNLRADVPATPGMERAPLVVLQGHTDMVCAVAPGSGYRPAEDPIVTVVEDGVLRSDRRSSLGADNNLGNAAVLYLLSRPVRHGPLRLLFTVAEEVGLQGAKRVDPAWLEEARYLINTDGFTFGQAVISSAGGRRETYTKKLHTVPRAGSHAFAIRLSGFLGGHSGYDIHKGRGNAIKLLALFLGELREQVDYDLADFRGEEILGFQHARAAKLTGFHVQADSYPGWLGDADNPLARAMAKVYRRQTGGKLDITAVHVGLEPSVLGARHPGLTMISSGPDIVNPHSTDEHAPIDTLAPYVRLLAGTLEELART